MIKQTWEHGDLNDKIIIELGYCKISIVICQCLVDQSFAEAEGSPLTNH